MDYNLIANYVNLLQKHYRNYNRQINTNKFYHEHNVKTCLKCKQEK